MLSFKGAIPIYFLIKMLDFVAPIRIVVVLVRCVGCSFCQLHPYTGGARARKLSLHKNTVMDCLFQMLAQEGYLSVPRASVMFGLDRVAPPVGPCDIILCALVRAYEAISGVAGRSRSPYRN